MVSQHLYDLDVPSAQFPDQLYKLLQDRGQVESLVNLPEDELPRLIDYLNGVRFLFTSLNCH